MFRLIIILSCTQSQYKRCPIITDDDYLLLPPSPPPPALRKLGVPARVSPTICIRRQRRKKKKKKRNMVTRYANSNLEGTTPLHRGRHQEQDKEITSQVKRSFYCKGKSKKKCRTVKQS